MPVSLRVFLAAAAFGAVASQAQASPGVAENFSYVDAAHDIDLTGTFTGSANGNDFTVSAISNLTFNGASVLSDAAFVDSLDAVNNFGSGLNGNDTPVVTFDGSYMDLFVDVPQGAFLFGAGDQTAGIESGPYYQGDESFSVVSGMQYAFVASDWTLGDGAPVPEPQAALLFGAGLAGLAAARRGRKAA